jgi:hypothetical protein
MLERVIFLVSENEVSDKSFHLKIPRLNGSPDQELCTAGNGSYTLLV